MKPMFKPENVKTFVLYPYRIFHVRLFFKRIVGGDRTMDYFAYVDCYRCCVERGDGIIDLVEVEAEERQTMEFLIDYDEAKRKAIESAITWGNFRVISWWLPKAEILREVEAYKIFWIFERKGKKMIMDSLTREVFEGFL